jgi:hypothetical protein
MLNLHIFLPIFLGTKVQIMTNSGTKLKIFILFDFQVRNVISRWMELVSLNSELKRSPNEFLSENDAVRLSRPKPVSDPESAQTRRDSSWRVQLWNSAEASACGWRKIQIEFKISVADKAERKKELIIFNRFSRLKGISKFASADEIQQLKG